MSWVNSEVKNNSSFEQAPRQFGDAIFGGDPTSVVALKGLQTIPLAVWAGLALVAIVYLKTRKSKG